MPVRYFQCRCRVSSQPKAIVAIKSAPAAGGATSKTASCLRRPGASSGATDRAADAISASTERMPPELVKETVFLQGAATKWPVAKQRRHERTSGFEMPNSLSLRVIQEGCLRPGTIRRKSNQRGRPVPWSCAMFIFIASHLTFSLAILFAAALSAPVHAQAPVTYRGMCDASASIALGKDHFVVADDEANVLQIYRRGQPDPVSQGVELFDFLGTAADDESDIEGAARIGNRIYWISSHGANKKGKVQDRRKRFFATEIVDDVKATVKAIGKPYAKLLEDLSKDSRFDKYDFANAAKKPPKSKGALNIEGLAATDDGKLYIGFRNPLSTDKNALIIPLENPGSLVADPPAPAGTAKFGDPIELFLEGRGIRSMENDGQGGFLIVAGAIDKEVESSLYRWSGKSGDKLAPLPIKFDGLNPEAMHLVPGTGELEILSDDGAIETAGVECKDQVDASKQSFRAITLKAADFMPKP
ncbi:MAG TPA: DUF3616 domain-containing protein [Bradyrhizobium sp.]|nr:DUF3616 domain-containing protein [Bradyrhizobium sp.]